MRKTAEAVSIGHPDKTADYISSYILDRFIEQDLFVRYAVEVMVKGNNVILGGEVTGHVNMSNLINHVKQALREIGYDENYSSIWGKQAININQLNVLNFIGLQSSDIGQGVEQNGWGDQGRRCTSGHRERRDRTAILQSRPAQLPSTRIRSE